MDRKAKWSAEAAQIGASYPPPYDEPVAGRKSWPLTRQFAVHQFGVNRVELAPGAWGTQRHWHKLNDEVVVVISGELVVVDDHGEELLQAGDSISFPAGIPNAHHLQNRGHVPAVYYDIGGRDLDDVSTFPDMGVEAKIWVDVKFKPIKVAPKA
jgi:uncharacterized cupin superfamily protein